MIGKCFGILAILSFLFGIICNNMENVCRAILFGASKSVTVTISLVGIMTLWSGFMNVFKKAGLIKKLSRLLCPILKFIFPYSFENSIATDEITMYVSANLLGISNAATPLAVNAVKEMQKHRKSDTASNDMITLAIMGCAPICLIPTTVIAIREAAGALITYEIMIPVWICSAVCCIAGIIMCRILGKIYVCN